MALSTSPIMYEQDDALTSWASLYSGSTTAPTSETWAGPNAAPTLADAERFYQGDVADNAEFTGYWDLYGDPPDEASWWTKDDQLTPEASQWFLNAQTGGEAERQSQAAADDDGMGDIMALVAIAAIIYTGGAAAGLWGAAEGAAVAGAAGAAEAAGGGLAAELAFGAPELAGAYSLSAGAAAGGAATVADGGAMDMFGSIASPAGYSPVAEGTLGTVFDSAAVNTINATTTPMGTGAMDQFGSLGTPTVSGVGGPGYVPVDTPAYMTATGSTLPSALTGTPSSGGLVDKAIEWAGKQVGSELIKDAIAPDAPTLPAPAAAPAKAPFGFFGGLPWKPKASSGTLGLNRLSTGKSVFGAGALASPGGIVSNWMGRG